MTKTMQKKISILGAGNIGLALATLWLRAGHSVCLGSRDPERLQAKINELNLNVAVKNIKEATAEGDIIVLAVPYEAIDDLVSTIKTEIHNKIIIDTTNPFGFSPEGYVISTLGPTLTAGTRMANLLPNNLIVRAFTHLPYELLVSRGIKQPGLLAIAIAGDDSAAKKMVATLVSDAGFVPVDIGTLVESGPLDPGGILFPQICTPAEMQLILKQKQFSSKNNGDNP